MIALTRAAPSLQRWKVIAFRPRRVPSAVEFGGKLVDAADVEFKLLSNGIVAGLKLFIPDFRESDESAKQIGYLLLDVVLGEYDVETYLGLIKMLPLDAPSEGERFPLAHLPRLFDQLISRLEKPSGKLS